MVQLRGHYPSPQLQQHLGPMGPLTFGALASIRMRISGTRRQRIIVGFEVVCWRGHWSNRRLTAWRILRLHSVLLCAVFSFNCGPLGLIERSVELVTIPDFQLF